MDKKKVKELIEKAIRDLSATDMGILYTQSTLEQALEELSKSDWVSVEDGLPPYDEKVLVCSKIESTTVWIDSRDKFNPIDNGFRQYKVYGNSITHWKPIEKLEE